MPYRLGVHNPAGGNGHPPHVPQLEFLQLDRTKPGISSYHYVGGRGCAKTTTGVLLAARTAYLDMPCMQGVWSEPRYADIWVVFLPEWEHVVPHQLWELTLSKREIRCHGGSVIKLVHRNVDNPHRRTNYGRNNAWGINDEMAEKCNPRVWADLKASVRAPGAPFYFMDSMSTPEMGPYYDICHEPGALVVGACSYDNPFIPRENIEDMERSMSPEYAAQEIYGRWVQQEGRCWASFSEEAWPAGNIHHASWDPSLPWYLGMDLGQGYGHWLIVQYHDPINPKTGAREYPDQLRVAEVVAEGVQHQESIHPVLTRIASHYAQTRPPVMVATGHDVMTRGSTGPAPSLAITQRGWECWYPTGELADKSIQGQVLAGMIANTMGERRLCISRDIQRHGPDRRSWGVLHCMMTDTFADPGSREKYRKDKGDKGISNCEDPRDSLMYLMTHNHPPVWAQHDRWAA